MPLTPADVHNVAFSKPPIGKRGYNEDEVDAFLDLVENELTRLIEENSDLRQRIEELDQELAAPPAARLQPLLVEPEHVRVRCTGGPFTDLRQDVHEPHELLGELRKDRREGVGLVAAQRGVGVVAEVALVTGRYERAARLIAAAQKERTAVGLVAFPMLRERTKRNLASAGTALGDESLERALQDGARLSLEEAVAYAQRGRGERASATHGWVSLTPVERQVVELASQGMSNPDIARELFISRNTVKVYLSRAYAKLGVANRTELARLATRHSQARQQR